MKRKTNYYLRVVKAKKAMKQNPIFNDWSVKTKLTKRQISRAIDRILAGYSTF